MSRPTRRPARIVDSKARYRLVAESLEARLCLTVVPTQLLPDAIGPQQLGEWNYAVDITDQYRVVGTPEAFDASTFDVGFVSVYDSSNQLFASIPNPEPEENDEFGGAVAVSGHWLAVAAEYDDVGAFASSGTVYVFDLAGPTPTVPTWTLTNPNPGPFDRFGSALGFDGDTLVVGAVTSDGAAIDTGNVFVFDLASPTPTVPQFVIPNPDPEAQDWFGFSVAIDGDRVVVGALLDDLGSTSDAGTAHVFDLAGSTPTEPLTRLEHPGTSRQFAGAVAISGDRVLVGSRLDFSGATTSGAVHLYDLSSPLPQTARLTINNPEPGLGDQFGHALDLDGQYAVVGSWLDSPGGLNAAGSAHVFDLDSPTPAVPMVDLEEPMLQAVDEFGFSVAIDQTTVLATSRFDRVGSGEAYLFDLTLANPELSIAALANVTPAANDRFGFALDVDRNLMAVGAPSEDEAGVDAGVVYVYDLSSGQPQLSMKLFSPTPMPGDAFGSSLAVNGSRIAVGAGQDDTGEANAGRVFVFDMDAADPAQSVLIIDNPAPDPDDQFGTSVDLDGDHLVVGAPTDDTPIMDAGAVFVFDLGGPTPSVPVLEFHHPDPMASTAFGTSLAMDEGVVVVGAPAGGGSAHAFDVNDAMPEVPIATFDDPGPTGFGNFGYAVATDERRIVVGAPTEDDRRGAAYVFDLDASETEMTVLASSSPVVDDFFGFAVALDGDQVRVSAPLDDTGAINSGRVFAFDLASGDPTIPTDAIPHPMPTDGYSLGDSLALNDGVFLAGASLDGTVNFQQGAVYAYVENTVPTLLDQVFALPEDDEGTLPFATVAAFDAESTVTFEIIEGTGAAEFTLDAQTGGLSSSGNLDFEMTASYDLLVAVTDDRGAVTTAQMTIAVTDVDDPPEAQHPNFGIAPLGTPLSEDAVLSLQVGGALPLDVFATDVDSLLDTESLAFDFATVTIDTTPTDVTDLSAIGFSYDSLTGELTLDPSNVPLFQSLNLGETAEVAVDFTVTTGPLSDAGVATFVVTGVNDAPIAWDPELGSVTDEDSVWLRQVGVDLNLNDFATDVDSELTPAAITWDSVEVTIEGDITSAADLSVLGVSYDGLSGELLLDPTGIPLFQSLAAAQVADLLLSFTVNDGDLADTGTLSFSMAGRNDAPQATDDETTIAEDTSSLLDVIANDDDVDTSAVLTITLATPPEHGSVMIVANQLEYVPSLDFVGTDFYGYTIEDEFGAFSSAVVQVTVTEVNDVPIAIPDDVTTIADRAVTFAAETNDLPGPPNEVTQSLTVTATNDAMHGTVMLNADGTITYTPDPGFTGQDSFTYTVEDNGLTHGNLDPRQATGTVHVMVDPPLPPGDFDQDGAFTCADINLLSEAVATSSPDLNFDLNGDGQLSPDDLLDWLAHAGAVNRPSGDAYRLGDANLDGLVDGLDFIIWNNNKFTDTTAFCSGDFDASGRVDGIDFLRWNDHKFMAAAGLVQTHTPLVTQAGEVESQPPVAPSDPVRPGVSTAPAALQAWRPSAAATDDVMRLFSDLHDERDDPSCRDLQTLTGDSLLQFLKA